MKKVILAVGAMLFALAAAAPAYAGNAPQMDFDNGANVKELLGLARQAGQVPQIAGVAVAAPAPLCDPSRQSCPQFASANFRKCLDIYRHSFDAYLAADKCIERTRSFQFLNNPNFDACYNIYHKSFDAYYAADTCIKKLSGCTAEK